MKAFLGSFTFLVLVLLIICIDHVVEGILGRSYKNIILYGLLSLVLVLAFIIAVASS